MAPALVERPAAPTPSFKGPSDYKEVGAVAGGPKIFNRERELAAKTNYPQYLPTWDDTEK